MKTRSSHTPTPCEPKSKHFRRSAHDRPGAACSFSAYKISQYFETCLLQDSYQHPLRYRTTYVVDLIQGQSKSRQEKSALLTNRVPLGKLFLNALMTPSYKSEILTKMAFFHLFLSWVQDVDPHLSRSNDISLEHRRLRI